MGEPSSRVLPLRSSTCRGHTEAVSATLRGTRRADATSRRGMTLIELLVVMAIIGILGSILFAVVGRARASARRTTCISNVKQLVQAAGMYASNWDTRYCIAYNDWGELGHRPWWVLLQPYMGSSGILRCPDRPGKWGSEVESWEFAETPGLDWAEVGYGWNTGVLGLPPISSNHFAAPCYGRCGFGATPTNPSPAPWGGDICGSSPSGPPVSQSQVRDPSRTILIDDLPTQCHSGLSVSLM